MLMGFVVLVLAYHALACVGAIDHSLSNRPSAWELTGLVWHVIVLAWGGLLLWLLMR